MKQVSNRFKEQIKNYGREFITQVSYNTGIIELLNDDDIVSITMSYQGSLLKSTMKEFDLECTRELKKGYVLNYKFGLLVDGEYEYIDYGDFIINEISKDANTGNYLIKAYDKMLYSMKYYEPLEIEYPITIRNYLKKICQKLGYTFENENDEFPNYDKLVEKDYFKDQSYTYRDILDQLAQTTASMICINQNERLELRYPTNTQELIDGDTLKDVNVEFGKTFGPINSIVLSRGEETDDMYKRDEDSIRANGICELKIKDNLFMSTENRGEFLQDIYDELNGFKYAIVDYDSIGIGYLELGDMYNIEISKALYPRNDLYPSNNLYPSGEVVSTIMLNDTFKTTTGINEKIYVDEPITSETDYTQATQYEKNERQADLLIERKLAKITIRANQIALEGYTTINGNFSIDLDGNMKCNNATIDGDVYFPATNTKAISSSGILTSLQFGSNGKYSGFDLCGFDYSGERDQFYKADCGIIYTIPNNFVVTNAYLMLTTTPIHWWDFYNNPVEGAVRNVSLFKGNQQQCPQYTMGYASESYVDNSQVGGTLIGNPFNNGNAFNGNTNFGQAVTMTSRDLVNDLNTQQGTTQVLFIRTNEGVSQDSNYSCYRTGLAKLQLMLVGYTKFNNANLLSMTPHNLSNSNNNGTIEMESE